MAIFVQEANMALEGTDKEIKRDVRVVEYEERRCSMERGDLDRRGDLSPGVACCYWEVGLKDDED